MPFLAQIFAKLLFCLGLMMTVVSCVIGSVGGLGTGGFPFMGVALMIVGGVLWRRTTTKVCPECAERIKQQARKCQYCGSELSV